MLTAGQRCYSGPAAGGGLADRVSASNASHAPATAAGGGHGRHQCHRRAAPAATAPPHDPAAPGWRGWPRPRGQSWPWGREGGGDGEMARGRKPVPLPRGPPSSRSGAQLLPGCGPARPGAAPTPSCSRRGWGEQHPHSPPGMLEEGWIQPQAERQPEQLGTLCPRRCPSPACPCLLLPGVLLRFNPGLTAGAARGCRGTSFLARGATPSCPPSARSRLHFYFRKVRITPWPAAVSAREQPWASGLVAAGPRGQSGSG